jgi:hypothetical protein
MYFFKFQKQPYVNRKISKKGAKKNKNRLISHFSAKNKVFRPFLGSGPIIFGNYFVFWPIFLF